MKPTTIIRSLAPSKRDFCVVITRTNLQFLSTAFFFLFFHDKDVFFTLAFLSSITTPNNHE